VGKGAVASTQRDGDNGAEVVGRVGEDSARRLEWLIDDLGEGLRGIVFFKASFTVELETTNGVLSCTASCGETKMITSLAHMTSAHSHLLSLAFRQRHGFYMFL
jgi:hypothetical protein